MKRLAGMALVLSAPATAVPVTLSYRPPQPVRSVAVAGSFNKWNPCAMQALAGGGYALTLDLAPGVYEYKFVVDGVRWTADPKAPGIPPNGNSPLWVAPAGQSTTHRRGDGRVLAFAVRHDPKTDVMRLDRTHVRIRLHTAADDVGAVRLVLPSRVVPMGHTATEGLRETWSATVRGTGVLAYRFSVQDGRSARLLYGTGPRSNPFRVDVAKMPLLEVPAWVRDTVWYQVFPERFRDGDRTINVKAPRGVGSWNTPMSAVAGNANDFWWGGDLKGVEEKLPYLKSLGITGIYLNPVFEGPDTHKYATTDYLKIAPEFGDEKALKDLVSAAHKAGTRVILDGVFNHTSIYFHAFRDVLAHQQNSKYVHWYHIRRWPVLDPATNYTGPDERDIPYDAWWGIKWMPKLNTDNPEVQRYLLKVATYWISRCDIDGWRLDVANEVSSGFWRKFRSAVKAAKPDAYLVGEIWETAAPWLQGDQFDAAMNYPLRAVVQDFFARGTTDAAQFVHALSTLNDVYPPQAATAMFNMLGSHDVPRLLTECKGDARRDALATLFQMTYPGSPCVYYGDENGMTGDGDPWNRAPMVWDKALWNRQLHDSYRRAIALRHRHPALRGAVVQTLSAEPGAKAFALLRRGGSETAITAFNVSSGDAVLKIASPSVDGAWKDVWRGGTAEGSGGVLRIALPPFTGAVLVR